MGKFIKGDIVVLPFPFSDLSNSKKRPALVLAILNGNDILLCQITSQYSNDSTSLTEIDFATGGLPVNSFIKHTKLFTADQVIFIKKAGHIKPSVTKSVTDKIIKLLKNE